MLPSNPDTNSRLKVLPLGVGAWTPDTFAARVSFSREPEDAHDLMLWTQWALERDTYGLDRRNPDSIDELFAAAINDTWELLRVVAVKRGWDDAPLRPEPNATISDAFENLESAYSLKFARQAIRELREYLTAKASPAAAERDHSDLPTLTEQYADILTAIGTDVLKGKDIAAKLPGRPAPDGGGFKTALSTLVRFNLLTNTTQAGYKLTEKGYRALRESRQRT